MDSFLKALFPCFPIGSTERNIQLPTDSSYSEKGFAQVSHYADNPTITVNEAATSIVTAMQTASKPSNSLPLIIQDLVHQAGGWSEYLAAKIISGLESVLKAGKEMNAVMQQAYSKACEAAKIFEDFAVEHPIATAVFCTVIALGILVVVAPYAVEYLGFWAGFGELGPIEGTWAAAWQSRYMGLVPKGSLFSYFQRLGMTYK